MRSREVIHRHIVQSSPPSPPSARASAQHHHNKPSSTTTLVTSRGDQGCDLADVSPRSGHERWLASQATGAFLLHTTNTSGPRNPDRQSIQRQHRGVPKLVPLPTRPMFHNLGRSENAQCVRYRRSDYRFCRHLPAGPGCPGNRHPSGRRHQYVAGRQYSGRRKPCPGNPLRLRAVGHSDIVRHVPYPPFPIDWCLGQIATGIGRKKYGIHDQKS